MEKTVAENKILGVTKDVIFFGKTDFRNEERLFGIKRRDRRQHTYIIGKSGTGKTALLHNMAVQDIVNGEGLCVVDPHGEFVESLLTKIPSHRLKDVIYFNPADTDYHLGFNVLELPDPKYKHLVASGLMAIFTKIWANVWSARMEYIMNNAILALLETPGSTLLGITRILVDKDFRQKIVSNVKDPVVKAFWINEYESWRDQFRNEAIAPIQNKVGQFLSTSLIRNVVGQQKSTVDIFDTMNHQKIFLVNVSKGRIGEDNSALLGAMLITKIQLAAMERVRISEDDRKDFYLYVDEFQNFATDSFAGILSEARKYRLNLILAHQYVGQLVTDVSTKVRDAVFGNVGTMIVFRVGAADAEFLENEFSPEFTIEDIVNLPNYHVYLKLLVDGIASRPFSAGTLYPFKAPYDSATEQDIINSSRKLYCLPRQQIEDDINRWAGMMGDIDSGYHEAEAPRQGGATARVEEKGKFPAVCSSCGKQTMVSFKPTPGRPVYCSDCYAKIKAGELRAIQEEPEMSRKPTDTSALAALGIEFSPMESPKRTTAPSPAPRQQKPGKPAPSRPSRQEIFKREQVAIHPKAERELSLDALKNAPKTAEKEKTSLKAHTVPDLAGLREALRQSLEKEKGE